MKFQIFTSGGNLCIYTITLNNVKNIEEAVDYLSTEKWIKAKNNYGRSCIVYTAHIVSIEQRTE